METEKLSKKEAEKLIRKSDKRRSGFYNVHTGCKWRDMGKFDICLDSGSLGIDSCVDILAGMVKNRRR